MTVYYTPSVSTAKFIDFVRVLIRWRGSVWKLILPELCIWLIAYSILNLVYRLALTEDQKRAFETGVLFIRHFMHYIPVTFILGFYLSLVMTRWWFQYSHIGWIDSLALMVASWINGTDEKTRLIRRAIVRYMLLYQVLILRNVSIRIRKIYPTIKSLFEAEIEHISGFRSAVIQLWLADWVPVPLVYTQITFTCVRSQLKKLQIKWQKILILDAYVPFLEIIQFFCYMGWVKVAEVLVNPQGEDDTDFETYVFIKRNLATAMEAADGNISWKPTLYRDSFWNDKNLNMLYTVETANIEQHPIIGSVATKLQSRRMSKDVQMIQRVQAESKTVKPIVDNSYQFEQPESSDEQSNTSEFSVVSSRRPSRGSITEIKSSSDNDEQRPVRRFHRIASKDSQLAAVDEVDEVEELSWDRDLSENDWSDAYLDEPANIKQNN
uniref:Bestrophin homolog n=1 Tax=Enterobius vermicularis TaxID=51028 RepID=A0A0N4V3I8_ENTVE